MGNVLDNPITYHRVMKKPIDDSMVFSSAAELMQYCTNGAVYNGMHTCVNYGNFSREYKVRLVSGVARPVMVTDGFEPFFKTIGGYKYMLVYYHNSDDVYSSSKATLTSDGFRFCLLDELDIFKDSGNYDFALEVYNRTTGAVTTQTWAQAANPITNPNGVMIAQSAGATITGIKLVTDNSNGYIMTTDSNIYLMPKIKRTDAIGLYIKASQYYNAMGVTI